MKTLAALALSLALLPACASSTAGDYFVNRGGDLVDIVRLHVAFGKAASVKVEATRMLHLGIGWEQDVWAWGLANREVGRWQESIFTWGLILGHHDERMIKGIDNNRLTGSYGWTFGKGGGNVFEVSDRDNWLDLLTLRATLMLGIGADAELRVGEAIDFLCGIFQFDPSGDDKAYSQMKKVEPAPAAAEKPKAG